MCLCLNRMLKLIWYVFIVTLLLHECILVSVCCQVVCSLQVFAFFLAPVGVICALLLLLLDMPTTRQNEIEAIIREEVARNAGPKKWICRGCGRAFDLGKKCPGQSCQGHGYDGIGWVEVSILNNYDFSEP